jgi:beta-glucosidase
MHNGNVATYRFAWSYHLRWREWVRNRAISLLPVQRIRSKAWEDGFTLHLDFHNENVDVHPASDACIVFVNEFSSEAFDQHGLGDGSADNLIRNVAMKCKNTIVVIHNAGMRLVDA